MLDQSLLQSHFIGRDGFRWWIGQVPPIDSWQDQANGHGWGLRVKVRILGYHPLDSSELSDEDLPWAQVMLPTTSGSGAANYAVNPKISQGDMVIGFFLDGDNAQIPVIMGLMGRTTSWSTLGYKSPFTPFTGYTDNIKDPKPSGRLANSPGNQANSQEGDLVQPTPPQVPPEVAQRLGTPTAYEGIGKDVVFANTCGDTTTATIKAEVNNFLKDIQKAQGEISKYQNKINQTAEVIKAGASKYVGDMIDAIYNYLVGTEKEPGILSAGLKSLYDTVYATTLASTQNPSFAHQAGSEAQAQFITPVKVLEEAISCVANNIVEGLKDIIAELLLSIAQNVKNFVTCAAEQFLASLLNTVVDAIASGLSSALGGVSSLLSGVFDVTQFLLSTVDAIKGLGSLFDCNQKNNKCDGVKEWSVGIGPKQSVNSDNSINNIFTNLNTIASSVQGIVDIGQSVPGQIEGIADSATGIANVFDDDLLQNALDGVNSCFYGTPTSCGGPQMSIFGGGGIGGAAVPILGPAIQSTTIYNNVSQTTNIIGALITDVGSGYTFPPFVEITDSCGLGYGAQATATINEQGQLSGIYVTSSGEGYPYFPGQDPYGVTDVYVLLPGTNYVDGDIATDNQGNQYRLRVDNGSIISATPINILQATDLPTIKIESETGFGAVLKPILGPITQKQESQKQIDCII
jgi:hypothetical protein